MQRRCRALRAQPPEQRLGVQLTRKPIPERSREPGDRFQEGLIPRKQADPRPRTAVLRPASISVKGERGMGMGESGVP